MKTTSLDPVELENFWIRCYLNTSSNLIEGVIDRAYLDFCRTLHGIGKEQNPNKKDRLKEIIRNIVSEILTQSFGSQDVFDEWHKRKCLDLVSGFDVISKHPLFIGQAQKWINMTLKYLFALGEKRIKGISNNYRFFHIPLDQTILDKLKDQITIKFKKRWSRIETYKEYLQYQNSVREKFHPQIPMDVEFRLFNVK
jgi:hypothetical protein